MRRFFADITGNEVLISGDEAHHIIDVLRLKPGEKIAVCDGCGNDCVCEISEISGKTVSAKILEKFASTAEAGVKVTLYQGLPKSDKMELIIQKAVELGVCEIVPVETKRCVSKIEPKKADAKTDRWNKISMSAAKQSGRGIIPEIKKPVSFAEAVEMMKSHDFSFAAYEEETENTIKSELQKNKGVKTIGFFIGPEGGIAPEEIEKIKEAGFPTVTLGERILRTETAPLAVLSMIMYEFE